MKNKIVLLFGSFNPVTKAHVQTLLKSMESVGASKGVFIPTSYEHIYSKMVKCKGRLSLSNEIRLKMLNSVCKADDRLSVCTYEMDNSIVSNTIETLEYLIEQNPDSLIYYTCGADKLKSLNKWKRIDFILSSVEVIVFKRNDIDSEDLIDNNTLLSKYKNKFHIIDNLISDISSTKVRELFFNGDKEYYNLLPEGVGEILESINPSDYPMTPLHTWVKLMHKYGGMHGPDIALKEVYYNNKEILKKFTHCETYFYESPKIENNMIYNDTNIYCTSSDSIEVTIKLNNEGITPAILNVCNRYKACGKYDAGYYKTKTDEEELCRCTSLSNYLLPYGSKKFKSVKECFIPHIEERYPLSFNNAIYCKDVSIIRNSKAKWYEPIIDDYNANIILVPAISFRIKETKDLLHDLKYKNSDDQYTDEGRELLKSIIENAFKIAILNHNDTIIITDFGITSYYLPVDSTLNILAEVISKYKNRFKNIILSLPYGRNNPYKTIYDIYGGE